MDGFVQKARTVRKWIVGDFSMPKRSRNIVGAVVAAVALLLIGEAALSTSPQTSTGGTSGDASVSNYKSPAPTTLLSAVPSAPTTTKPPTVEPATPGSTLVTPPAKEATAKSSKHKVKVRIRRSATKPRKPKHVVTKRKVTKRT